jgi:hypothetical protein
MKEQTLSPAERCPALSVDPKPLLPTGADAHTGDVNIVIRAAQGCALPGPTTPIAAQAFADPTSQGWRPLHRFPEESPGGARPDWATDEPRRRAG